jgi:hypothetical protein
MKNCRKCGELKTPDNWDNYKHCDMCLLETEVNQMRRLGDPNYSTVDFAVIEAEHEQEEEDLRDDQ